MRLINETGGRSYHRRREAGLPVFRAKALLPNGCPSHCNLPAAAREAGIDYSTTLGSVVAALTLFVVGVMAIAQLRINTDIIRFVTICVLSGVALAFGLSFGLGTRDITRNILAGFYARKVFRVGDQVEIRGHRGTLSAITPVRTVVEGERESAVMAERRLPRRGRQAVAFRRREPGASGSRILDSSESSEVGRGSDDRRTVVTSPSSPVNAARRLFDVTTVLVSLVDADRQ